MKKTISIILMVSLMISMSFTNVSLAAVTNADLSTDKVGSKWEVKLGTGYASAPTPPLLHNGYLYVGSGNKIYKLNKETGTTVKTSSALAGNMGYAMMPPVFGSGMIFISVNNGQVQALDPDTLAIKWTSVARTGYTNSPVIYDEASGKIFFATWNNKNEGGEYICLNAANGKFNWAIPHGDGFYWSGPYIGDDYVIFGSESIYNTTDSTIFSVNKDTGDVISSMGAVGNIRSTIVGDQDNIYVPTQSARLYKIEIDNDGSFISSTNVITSGSSTGKPTILDGKIYFGTSGKTIDVYNLSDLSRDAVSPVNMPAYPQAEFLIRKNNDSSLDIYSSYNAHPGGICHVNINGNNKSVDKNFFVPANSQFCTSPLICDDSGTIYYKNDSCYLMAVDLPERITASTPSVKSNSYNSVKVSWSKMSGATGYDVYRSTSPGSGFRLIKSYGVATTSFTDSGLTAGKKYYYRLQAKYAGANGTIKYSKFSQVSSAIPVPAKPSIKTKAAKKKVRVSWKKVTGASGYVIYRATKKNGKYKKVKTIKKGSTKSWTNKKLKSKKKYYYKVRAYRNVSGKKVYSVYSNISYKKVK